MISFLITARVMSLFWPTGFLKIRNMLFFTRMEEDISASILKLVIIISCAVFTIPKKILFLNEWIRLNT